MNVMVPKLGVIFPREAKQLGGSFGVPRIVGCSSMGIPESPKKSRLTGLAWPDENIFFCEPKALASGLALRSAVLSTPAASAQCRLPRRRVSFHQTRVSLRTVKNRRSRKDESST